MHHERLHGLAIERRRRLILLAAMTLATAGLLVYTNVSAQAPAEYASVTELTPGIADGQEPAATALARLPVKGRAPKTGFTRKQFGNGWAATGNCTMRDRILARDFAEVRYVAEDDCTVAGGQLHDPYTGKTINFSRGKSSTVQIDHIVALSDAWQTGAQQLPAALREQLANDPLELIAADGPANNEKSDADAASWLPANKPYRCRYVARQIAVKAKYDLWVTAAERDAMQRVLQACPEQVLPVVNKP